MKTYEQILKKKQDYYGKTEASYEFAAEEYAKEYCKEQLSLHNRKNQKELFQAYQEGFNSAVESLQEANKVLQEKWQRPN